MYCLSSSTFLLFLLPLTLSAPTPNRALEPRDSCVSPELTAFNIQNLQIFNGDSISSISFNYLNPSTSVATTCSRILSGNGLRAAGISIADGTWTQCDNVIIAFKWDGTTVFILHGWSCDVVGVAGGHVAPSTFCFPVQPPYPFGEGLLCETPTGQAMGVLTNNWEDTGRTTYQVDGDGNPMT